MNESGDSMISFKKAVRAILEEYDDMTIQASFDYKDMYIFTLVPKDYDEERDGGYVDNFYAVRKADGVVGGFAPWADPDFFKTCMPGTVHDPSTPIS